MCSGDSLSLWQAHPSCLHGESWGQGEGMSTSHACPCLFQMFFSFLVFLLH